MVTSLDPASTASPARPPGSPANDAVPVVFIAGSGRSGSTLLERIVGGVPGFVNVGELIGLFRWIAPVDEKCGCGEPFSRCPFWISVGEHAFGGWTPDIIQRVADLQQMVARQRRLPQLLGPQVAIRSISTDLSEYQDHYRRLYRAIADVAGARVVVDASKWPVQALALGRSQDLDVRLLHLVRDVRGVAYSWAKSGVARPHAVVDRATMEVHPVARTAARWSVVQAEAEAVGRLLPHYCRIRYEDVVARPEEAVLELLRRLDVDAGIQSIDHIEDGTVTLASSHGIGGNPSRFRVGPTSLTLDEKWRTAMSRRHRSLATAAGLPGLTRYGYLKSR